MTASSETSTRDSLSRYQVSLPSSATSQEAAAIITAINTLLRQTDRATEPGGRAWHGNRWTFAGRIEAIGGPPLRIPTTAPTDPWTAAGRISRF